MKKLLYVLALLPVFMLEFSCSKEKIVEVEKQRKQEDKEALAMFNSYLNVVTGGQLMYVDKGDFLYSENSAVIGSNVFSKGLVEGNRINLSDEYQKKYNEMKFGCYFNIKDVTYTFNDDHISIEKKQGFLKYYDLKNDGKNNEPKSIKRIKVYFLPELSYSREVNPSVYDASMKSAGEFFYNIKDYFDYIKKHGSLNGYKG